MTDYPEALVERVAEAVQEVERNYSRMTLAEYRAAIGNAALARAKGR